MSRRFDKALGIFGVQFNNSQKFLETATDLTLVEPYWEGILGMCFVCLSFKLVLI